MSRTKSILRTVVGGLLLGAVMAMGGCGDGHHHHMSYGGRNSYPTYSRSDGGRDGGFRSHSDGGGHADRDDSWRHR